jgi:hypothetical protein
MNILGSLYSKHIKPESLLLYLKITNCVERMKFNLKSIFGIKSGHTTNSHPDMENFNYDKNVDFYYFNLINSIILFSLTSEELKKLMAPTFDPIFELESEADYAFLPVLFETIFRNKLINESLRAELLSLKKDSDDIPSEIWDWNYFDEHPSWINLRLKANTLLDKLGIESRTFHDTYTTYRVQ